MFFFGIWIDFDSEIYAKHVELVEFELIVSIENSKEQFQECNPKEWK